MCAHLLMRTHTLELEAKAFNGLGDQLTVAPLEQPELELELGWSWAWNWCGGGGRTNGTGA
jgi:hypothetical protein